MTSAFMTPLSMLSVSSARLILVPISCYLSFSHTRCPMQSMLDAALCIGHLLLCAALPQVLNCTAPLPENLLTLPCIEKSHGKNSDVLTSNHSNVLTSAHSTIGVLLSFHVGDHIEITPIRGFRNAYSHNRVPSSVRSLILSVNCLSRIRLSLVFLTFLSHLTKLLLHFFFLLFF